MQRCRKAIVQTLQSLSIRLTVWRPVGPRCSHDRPMLAANACV